MRDRRNLANPGRSATVEITTSRFQTREGRGGRHGPCKGVEGMARGVAMGRMRGQGCCVVVCLAAPLRAALRLGENAPAAPRPGRARACRLDLRGVIRCRARGWTPQRTTKPLSQRAAAMRPGCPRREMKMRTAATGRRCAGGPRP